MSISLQEADKLQVKEIAARYGISVLELGKLIVKTERKNTQRQFRVSDDEYAMIHNRASEKNMTLMCYCEFACAEFLKLQNIDYAMFSKQYGEGRFKRIAVTFKNKEVEKELVFYAEKIGIEVGSLIRTCALSYG